MGGRPKKLTRLVRARRSLRSQAKGDTCETCRAIGRQMFGRPVCFRSRTERCHREQEFEAARTRLDSGVALDALRLWDGAQSQWRVGGMGGAYGLDYGALEVVARAKRIELDEDLLDLIQTLEADQLEEWERARQAREAAAGR